MKSKLYSLLFAVATPAFALSLASSPSLADDDQTPAAKAVASVCIDNTTDYRVVLETNWGFENERWGHSVFEPHVSGGRVTLTLNEKLDDVKLTVRFPASPKTPTPVDVAIPATWSTTLEDDCSKLPNFIFALRGTDGGEPKFVLEAKAPST